MSKLEDLVPPLELCRQIPKGKFEDTVLVWLDCQVGPIVREYENHEGAHYYKQHGLPWYPAPTLQEIMIAIEDSGFYCPTCYHQANRWAVDCEQDAGTALYDAEDKDNPAAAALKLWLELEGKNDR